MRADNVQELKGLSLTLAPQVVREYLAAVDDRSPLYREGSFVPPTAVAALAIGALLGELSLPPGVVHAAQELEFLRPLTPGEWVSLQASLSSRGARRGYRFLTVELLARGPDGGAVLRGKSTLLAPAGEEL